MFEKNLRGTEKAVILRRNSKAMVHRDYSTTARFAFSTSAPAEPRYTAMVCESESKRLLTTASPLAYSTTHPIEHRRPTGFFDLIRE